MGLIYLLPLNATTISVYHEYFIGAFKFSKILKLVEMADSGDELYNAASNTAY